MCFSEESMTQIDKNIFPVSQKYNLRNPKMGMKAGKKKEKENKNSKQLTATQLIFICI